MLKHLFAQRALRAVIAGAVIAAAAAGATYATTTSGDRTAASGVIHACVKDNGDIRIVSGAAQCRTPERAIQWAVEGPAGPVGPPGPKGDTGADGKDGTSVATAALPVGSHECPYGGSSFTVAPAAPTFACNGAPGKNGSDATLTSIDSLSGLSCSANGETGNVSLASGSANAITLTCVTASSTCQTVPNGHVTCGGTLLCNAGWADADGKTDDGCEANLASDVNNCGSVGNVVPTEPHSIPACVGGTPALICNSGWFDVNHTLADGCESQLPSCESNPHQDGLGGTYPSCDPVGTFNQTNAWQAATRWASDHMTSRSTTGPATCSDGGGGTVQVITASVDDKTWAVWAYGGSSAGHVRTGAYSAGPWTCPTTADPAWQ